MKHNLFFYTLFIISALLLSCARKMEMETSNLNVGLASIGFCETDNCLGDGKKLNLTVKDGFVLVYLDLRKTGNLHLVSNIKNDNIGDPQIIISSTTGDVIGSARLNYTVAEYKNVTEDYYILFNVESEKKRFDYRINQPSRKNQYPSKIGDVDYGDNDILPQVIPLLQKELYEECLIYITFNLKYSSVDVREKKKDTSLHTVHTIFQNICSPPRSFTLLAFRKVDVKEDVKSGEPKVNIRGRK